MCGRYTGYVDDSEELKTIYTLAKRSYPNTKFKEGEIFPTDTVPVIINNNTRLAAVPASWGIPGYGSSKCIINGRCETILERPTFRDSFLRHRCIVPTTGYYEWNSAKQRFIFNLSGERVVYLGGIYNIYPDSLRFVILTVNATGEAASVHKRMPLVLTKDILRRWEYETDFATSLLTSPAPHMLMREA